MITLDIAKFRTLFPAYANVTTYPDATVTMNWETSTLYVSAEDYGYLQGESRARALYLLTAHLFRLSDIISSGQTPGLLSAASIDKISVTLTPPPLKSQFHWWLSLTPYGQQLLALLRVHAMGGFFVGGSAERAAFRKPGGGF